MYIYIHTHTAVSKGSGIGGQDAGPHRPGTKKKIEKVSALIYYNIMH